jgi:hypothetical protein
MSEQFAADIDEAQRTLLLGPPAERLQKRGSRTISPPGEPAPETPPSGPGLGPYEDIPDGASLVFTGATVYIEPRSSFVRIRMLVSGEARQYEVQLKEKTPGQTLVLRRERIL